MTCNTQAFEDTNHSVESTKITALCIILWYILYTGGPVYTCAVAALAIKVQSV